MTHFFLYGNNKELIKHQNSRNSNPETMRDFFTFSPARPCFFPFYEEGLRAQQGPGNFFPAGGGK